MKKRMLFAYFCISVCHTSLNAQENQPADSFYLLSPVEVKSVRVYDRAPFTKTNLSAPEIKKRNLGQDIPFLLSQTPSVVVNSDAGNGIGYTGIRIRGTDATRINVTLNGIPYNDAESQGTFFVDIPDFLSSAGSIQIQRGVGTSTNGAGAFGASIHISTNEVNKEPYLELNNSFGSFNSWKHTLRAGTGLKNKFTADVRLSRITSDGYIDRAFSRLHSFYVSTARIDSQQSFRLNVFSGKEKTYQAWYGVSENDLKAGKRTLNPAGTEKPGDPYDNETDNYTQTHFQFFYNRKFNPRLQTQLALFYTIGQGYYEQYKADQRLSRYGIPNQIVGNDTIRRSDLVRQLWLDNDFFGTLFSLQYNHQKHEITAGGGAMRYLGLHYGKVIRAIRFNLSPRKWYDLDADKNDFHLYVKHLYKLNAYWNLFYDLQYRHVGYDINGFRNNPTLFVSNRYHFFNPKAGLSFQSGPWRAYLSHAIGTKEPNRDDFEAGLQEQPRPEQLFNTELGIGQQQKKYQWQVTLYHMYYKNQLILTGKINDVGAYTRTNVPQSYRAGIELEAAFRPSPKWQVGGNATLSQNKVKRFTEYIDDYDNGGQQRFNYQNTQLAFSPSLIAAGQIQFFPLPRTEILWMHKYVSRQYLDNTQNKNRSLNPFYVSDLQLMHSLRLGILKEAQIIFRLNNLFNTPYEPNGYTFSYISGGQTVTENYYYPMAGLNFMVALNLRL
ncbi:MAG: TonB-dependent receptor [Chitinophagaceae bacterium]|nr:TonB-dependent receptor [Chitinophagaceae bacterium]